MRIVILLCLAAFLMGFMYEASAEMELNDGYIAIRSNDYKNSAIGVHVESENDCVPSLGIYTFLDDNDASRPDYKSELSWRVDRRPVRSIGYTVVSTDIGEVMKLGNMTGALGVAVLEDLRRGNTLRIKNKQGAYDSFSLAGFSKMFGQLKAACKPHGSYFQSDSKHEIFL